MNFRGISIPVAVISLLVVHALSAFQAPEGAKEAPDAIKEVTRKAKKATKDKADTAGRAAYPATGKEKKATVKAETAAPPETAATRQAASSTTDTAKRTARRADRMASSAADTATPTSANIVSDSEIAAAKASGRVWVNTDSGTYHKGGRWYGATKQGKFMTEQDAIGAGYHAARSKTH